MSCSPVVLRSRVKRCPARLFDVSLIAFVTFDLDALEIAVHGPATIVDWHQEKAPNLVIVVK